MYYIDVTICFVWLCGFNIFLTLAYFVVISEECIYAAFDMTRKNTIYWLIWLSSYNFDIFYELWVENEVVSYHDEEFTNRIRCFVVNIFVRSISYVDLCYVIVIMITHPIRLFINYHRCTERLGGKYYRVKKSCYILTRWLT